MPSVIDQSGYRACVGIILCNEDKQVLWARRSGQMDWQFPQGGVNDSESVQAAMYRELFEEVGLRPQQVHMLGCTGDWLKYDIPVQYRRSARGQAIKGQKQIWYLLRLQVSDADVCLDGSDKPEFDDWCWIDYWQPLDQIIEFKREVYQKALAELEPLLENTHVE